MKQIEIEKAAKEYAEKGVPQFDNAECKILTKAYKIGFVAGAEFRQPEIDTLKETIAGLKATLDIEVNKHQPRLKAEIDDLVGWLQWVRDWASAHSLKDDGLNEFIKKYE